MRFLSSERADVEIIGHIIILGLTMTGIAMITLVGVPAIYQLQERANIQNIELTYTMLDSRASKVALGDTPRQVIDINLGGGSFSVKPNSSSEPSFISIEFTNGSDIARTPIPMGKVVYRMGDREVAYEGGGVWSKYPAGSVMLSPPEFNYNGVTTTFPIVSISGNFSAGGKGEASLNFEKKDETQIILPTPVTKNPLDANITIVNFTIKSEYYDAWADYFRSIALVKVNEFPGEKKVTVTLETPPLFTNFSYGALASKKIKLKPNAETDSYNSSGGKNYENSKSGNGSIRATDEIEIENNALVNGSAMTGGDITGGGEITKDAYADEIDDDITVGGDTYGPIEGFSTGSTASTVQRKINDYISSNNNNDSSAGSCLKGVGNRTLDSNLWSGDTCTISTGNYYLTTFYLNNNDILIFDTAGGPVNIAVDTDFNLAKPGSNITVSGNKPVKLYLTGRIFVKNGVKINPTNNDNSSLFQITSSSPQNIDLINNAYFCGFIWAPDAKITVNNNMQVYGALVGKEFILENGEKMHYDEALQNLNIQVTSGTTIRYLYITRNNVTASAD